MSVLVKCAFPGCRIIGEGAPGRAYACAKHTRWLVAGFRGLKAVAAAAAVEGAKQIRKQVKPPWWMQAFYEGLRSEDER